LHCLLTLLNAIGTGSSIVPEDIKLGLLRAEGCGGGFDRQQVVEI
jgi:hypothetical protein